MRGGRVGVTTLTGGELDAEPYAHRHDSVVDDVQCGHLVVFLAHDEEELKREQIECKTCELKLTTEIVNVYIRIIIVAYRVEELCEFREVVPPTTASHLLANKNETIMTCNTALSIGNSETSVIQNVFE